MPGEFVKWCSTLLPSQPQHAATNDCLKRQWRQMLLSFARLEPQGKMQSKSENGKVGWELSRGLVLRLQADFLIILWLPSGFSVVHSPFSVFPPLIFPPSKMEHQMWLNIVPS